MGKQDFPAVDVGHGVTRRALADSPELMLAEFAFSEGGQGAVHRHPHAQTAFIQAGRYSFTLGEETFEVGPGDAFAIPSNVTHSCELLEGPGVLIDSFAPRRDDFL